jgi:hypothetical protein
MTRTMERPRLSDTTVREGQLSDLTRRIARAREAAAHGTTEREIMIRRYGLAHPRSIDASQRLVHAQQAQRRLTNRYDRSVSEFGRMKAHDRVRLMVHHIAQSDG